MRTFAAIALIELVLIGVGALLDRLFPDLPTSVLGTAVALLLACGIALLLWVKVGESKDENKLRMHVCADKRTMRAIHNPEEVRCC